MLGRRAIGWCVILMLPTVGLGQSDRLQIRFNGEATLSVSGDVPEFGFGPYTLVYGWGICGGSGSCTRDYPWSIMGSVARWGAGTGYSFSTSINLILHNNFIFDFNPPTFSVPGYTYSYKHSLGFIYFAQPLGVGSGPDLITSAWCGPYQDPPPDCCSSSYAELSFSVALRTSVGTVEIGEHLDSSCSAGENCEVNFELIEWPTSYREERGYKPHLVDLGTRQGSTVHRENVETVLQLRAFGTLCGAAGGTVGGGASTGIVLQSAPHPLDVPAIGENEYVWGSDRPAMLTIPARAYAYTWGWEADLGWIADKTVFRVEPGIPSDDTKPGVRTVVRGRELVAQSLDGQTDGYVDDLFYRSKYLPPYNSDFGKKKVYFEVEGNKVDYADIEVFYPSDAANHPPSGSPASKRPEFRLCITLACWEGDLKRCLAFGSMCTEATPSSDAVPNWLYYYAQEYGVTNEVCWGGRAGSDYAAFCPFSGDILLFAPLSPCGPARELPLYVEERRGERRFINFSGDSLIGVRGFHKFIGVVEHERTHKRLWREGIDLFCCSDADLDRDGDGLLDSWEEQHGLDPTTCNTAHHIYKDGEVLAQIVEYGALRNNKHKWHRDWAECGLQYLFPASPFPWGYSTAHPRENEYLTKIPGE